MAALPDLAPPPGQEAKVGNPELFQKILSQQSAQTLPDLDSGIPLKVPETGFVPMPMADVVESRVSLAELGFAEVNSQQGQINLAGRNDSASAGGMSLPEMDQPVLPDAAIKILPTDLGVEQITIQPVASAGQPVTIRLAYEQQPIQMPLQKPARPAQLPSVDSPHTPGKLTDKPNTTANPAVFPEVSNISIPVSASQVAKPLIQQPITSSQLDSKPKTAMNLVNREAFVTIAQPGESPLPIRTEVVLPVVATASVDTSDQLIDLKPPNVQTVTASPQPSAQVPVNQIQEVTLLKPSHTISTPAGQAGWGQEVSTKVTYMIKNDQQVAELRLNPASLGVVEVRISTDNDKAEVTFFAQNAATRELIEAAMPRLRETLSANGVSLEQVMVSDESLSEQRQQSELAGTPGKSDRFDSDDVEAGEYSSKMRQLSSDKLIDTYI